MWIHVFYNSYCGSSNVFQKEHDHIRLYALKREELHHFFRNTLTEESVNGLFLSNVRKLLKVHAVGIMRPNPSWDAFLREITKLDNKEPRNLSLIKGGIWKPVKKEKENITGDRS